MTEKNPRDPEQDDRETYDLLSAANELEALEGQDDNFEDDLAVEEAFDTQHSDGHTYNVQIAIDQGLTYTPPTDPPIQPGERSEEVDIAAGFAPSMEAANPDVEVLPDEVDNNDLDLMDNIETALTNNSETGHLDQIFLHVDQGVVSLYGKVQSQDDLAVVEDIVGELGGVKLIHNHLQVDV